MKYKGSNMIKGYIYLGLFLGILGVGSYVYNQYNNMVQQISNQKVIIENKQKEILTQESNIKNLKINHLKELSKVKAEIKIKQNQIKIEKETDYDKTTSREITSTYIDL